MSLVEHSGGLEIALGHLGVTTLFLFDYNCLETPDGDSVFRSIRVCLERSEGVCALSDTGVLSAKALAKFADKAVCTKPVAGGVVGTRRYRSIRPSVAALWTDRPENVELFHDYLNIHTVPRYQGAVLLDEDVSYEAFLGFCSHWSPPATDSRSSRLGTIMGVGGRVDSHFKRIGASIGGILAVAVLVFMVTQHSTVVPVAVEIGRHEGSELAGSVTPGIPSQRTVAPGVSHPPFTVQVGSFRNAASAAGLVRQLKSRGYRAFVSTTKLADGQIAHRVRVGGFHTRRGASAFGENLKQRESFITVFFVAPNG